MTSLPNSTTIFLTRKPNGTLLIKPDTTFQGDMLSVAYDVKYNGRIVIPKGSRANVTWTSQTIDPVNNLYGISLDVNSVFVNGKEYPMNANSSQGIYNTIVRYDGLDTGFKPYFYQTREIRTNPKFTNRSFVKINNVNKQIPIGGDMVYIKVPVTEVMVALNSELYID